MSETRESNATGRISMKSIIAAILALSAAASHAGEWVLQVHGHSHHFQPRNHFTWNEFNPGLAIRYSFNSDIAVQVGRYLNSYSLPGYDAYTDYIAADYTPWHHKRFSFGGYAGIGNGYDEPYYYIVNGQADVTRIEKRPISASAGLLTRFEYDRFNITVRVNPAMAEVEYGVKF